MGSDKKNILFSGIVFGGRVFVDTFGNQNHGNDEKVADNDTVSQEEVEAGEFVDKMKNII